MAATTEINYLIDNQISDNELAVGKDTQVNRQLNRQWRQIRTTKVDKE